MLVVDDEPSIRLLCRVNLEIEGQRVLEAGTLAEARRWLEAERVDVILLDVHVGAESGWTLLEELQDLPDDQQVAVALLTGSAELAPEERARVDGTICKPFTLEELASTVQRLLTVGFRTR